MPDEPTATAPCPRRERHPDALPQDWGWRGMLGRLRYAATTARHAQPKTFAARLRLLWHDFVIHGLLHRGSERCQDCGRDYPAWHADGAEWKRVMGGPGGLLCAACFARRARRWQLATANELLAMYADDASSEFGHGVAHAVGVLLYREEP